MQRSSLAALGVLALLTLLLGEGRAFGQEASQKAHYKELIRHALDEYGRGNWTEARVFFSEAHAISPNARTFRGLGMVCYESRKYVEAIGFLEQALVNHSQPLGEGLANEVREVIEQAKHFVSRAQIDAVPNNATITLDGSPVESASSRPVLLDPGAHEVQATAEGYEPISRTLTAEGGQPLRVHLILRAFDRGNTPVTRAPGPEVLPEQIVEKPVPPVVSAQNAAAAAVLVPLGLAGMTVGWIYYAMRQQTRTRALEDPMYGVPINTITEFHVRGWVSLSAMGVGASLLSFSEYFWLPDDPTVPVWAWLLGGAGVAVGIAGAAWGFLSARCDIGDSHVICQAFTADAAFGPLIAMHGLPLLTIPINYALRSVLLAPNVEVAFDWSGSRSSSPILGIRGAF